ncbi:MAG: polyhydroxybutyrate depolymerase [Proteobacteria bacterium]|nr:MAG: polyhydroxybutyrate depolymerase [Pseudomonadota bacterium]
MAKNPTVQDYVRFRLGGVLLLGLSAFAGQGRAELAPGDHAFTLNHQQRTRSYIVHVPRIATFAPRAVVLNFHGGGGSAANQQSYSRMDATADRHGFLAVYPNGTGRFGTRLLTWNAGTCCGSAQKENVDDVGFARAVIEDLTQRTPIDRNRIYATGLSNGAMMAYRLAAEASDLIAAIAPVAGGEMVDFHPSRPMAILHIHSVDDPRAQYAGGLGPSFPLTNSRVMHPAVEQTIARWATFDGCPRQPRADVTLRGTGKTATHTATRITYAPCKAGTTVILWKLTGSGHVWPGGRLDYLPGVLGAGTDVIDANDEMWKFFSRHTL